MEGRRLLIALLKLEHQGGSELMSPIPHVVRSTIIRPGITGLRVGDVTLMICGCYVNQL